MNYKFELRWYECNLTQRKSKKFFTEIGAVIYKWYIERFRFAYGKIYEL